MLNSTRSPASAFIIYDVCPDINGLGLTAGVGIIPFGLKGCVALGVKGLPFVLKVNGTGPAMNGCASVLKITTQRFVSFVSKECSFITRYLQLSMLICSGSSNVKNLV